MEIKVVYSQSQARAYLCKINESEENIESATIDRERSFPTACRRLFQLSRSYDMPETSSHQEAESRLNEMQQPLLENVNDGA